MAYVVHCSGMGLNVKSNHNFPSIPAVPEINLSPRASTLGEWVITGGLITSPEYLSMYEYQHSTPVNSTKMRSLKKQVNHILFNFVNPFKVCLSTKL